MRKIVALLLLLFLVVSPVLAANSATDVEGTIDDKTAGYDYYKEIVQYAAAQQEAKDCPAQPYLQPKTETVIERLEKDTIFFFNGHCAPGMMGIKADESDPNDHRWIYAKNGPPEEKALDNLELSNLNFIFFDCCNSAGSAHYHGNLVKIAVQRGAHCAFGFKEEVRRLDTATLYGQSFWNSARKGDPWVFSHNVALNALKKDPHIVDICEKRPVKNMCGYDSLDYEPKKGDGCLSHLQSNPEATKTITQPMETTSQPSGLETATITLEQAQNIIREFTGNPELKIKYWQLKDKGSTNEFESIDGSNPYFRINTLTHRVESADLYPWFTPTTKSDTKIISLDEAEIIAEKFAKRQYPQLWKTTDKIGVNTSEFVVDLGAKGNQNQIVWEDEYYYPDKNTPGHITVKGLKSIIVFVTPGGEIFSYREHLTPRDESVSLKPDITEEQAWEIAKKRFAEHYSNITDDDKISYGLQLTSFSNLKIGDFDGKQTLTWYFELLRNEHNPGGGIAIDAHDGHVVFHSPNF